MIRLSGNAPAVSRIIILIALCSACILFSTAYSEQYENHGEKKPTSESVELLKSDLDSIMHNSSVPGAAVALVSKDSIIWIGTFGFANMSTREPITENTLFCIGSCTKSFTGLAFLKLMDVGRIDINTPVRAIAPEIKINNRYTDTHPVRIVHLLEHTAGFDDSHPNWFYLKGPVLTLKQSLDKKQHLLKARWEPGTRFSYSSVGFDVAGYVLEKISGQPYEEYMRQEILIPLGMTDSRIGYSQKRENPVAVGYDRNLEPLPLWYDYDVPAGAMYSSIREMAIFVKFLLNQGRAEDRQLISSDMLSRVGHPTSTSAAKFGLESGYSFGIGTRYRGGAKWYGHGGAVPGFLAEYYYNPDSDLGFVVLQNWFGIIFDSDIFDRVWEFAISQADSISPGMEPIACDQLKQYAGYYAPCNPRLQIAGGIELLTGGLNIRCQNDTLYTQAFMESGSPLLPVRGNLFRRPWHPEATWVFIEEPGGKMTYASAGSYYERAGIWKVYVYRFLVFGATVIMISSIPYAIFWIPLHIYKKLRKQSSRSKYISMRLVPLLAVLSLLLGFIKMSNQTLLGFGLMTPLNIIFFVSTVLFAGFSISSLFTTYRSFYKPVRTSAKVYATLLSASCFGITLLLWQWGIIGIRLWSY
jgi:CubicO group peptidase (beta-lactamase class C family)